jgi:hypothetical protein
MQFLQYREMCVGKPSVRAVVFCIRVCHLPLSSDHWAIQLHPHRIFNDLSHPANGTSSKFSTNCGEMPRRIAKGSLRCHCFLLAIKAFKSSIRYRNNTQSKWITKQSLELYVVELYDFFLWQELC